MMAFFLILPLAGVLPAFSYEAHPDFGLSITRLDDGVGVGYEVVSFIADHLKKTKINGKVLSDYFIMEESSELYESVGL